MSKKKIDPKGSKSKMRPRKEEINQNQSNQRNIGRFSSPLCSQNQSFEFEAKKKESKRLIVGRGRRKWLQFYG